MTRDSLERRPLIKLRGAAESPEEDWVVVEEPLEIRVERDTLAVVMRTPGADLELAAGFALTEGVIRSAADLGTIRHCPDARKEAGDGANVVEIGLAPGVNLDRERMRRALLTSAACGVCGKASLEALATHARPVASDLRVERAVLGALPGRLAEAQDVFRRTGALHAAGLFSPSGDLRICREDVGRHNAVDKVIGRCLLDGAPTSDGILLVSGRTSFEILQKAAVAGIPIVCAVSGPTTLAIETARAFSITLINFLRGGDMSVAACPERILGLEGRSRAFRSGSLV